MKRILCIGDSNTWGYDPRSYIGERYPEGVYWTDRLPGWLASNAGINGSTVPDDWDYAETDLWLRAGPYDVITVMLGTNDLLLGWQPAEIADKMEPYLRHIQAKAGTAALLLLAPPPSRHGSQAHIEALLTRTRQLCSLYASLAAKLQILFADAGQWSVELAFDGVHFTPEGHAAFAEGLAKVLATL